MTTESQHTARNPGVSVLLGAVGAGALLGVAAAVVGALTEGSAAAVGALVGTAVVLFVFAFGAFAVELVSRVVPAMSLLVALLSYALQLVLMLVILMALDESGLVGTTLDRYWLVGAVIVGTIGWLVAQVVITTRLRVPAFDLPEAGAR